eukprot:gene32386-39977_t
MFAPIDKLKVLEMHCFQLSRIVNNLNSKNVSLESKMAVQKKDLEAQLAAQIIVELQQKAFQTQLVTQISAMELQKTDLESQLAAQSRAMELQKTDLESQLAKQSRAMERQKSSFEAQLAESQQQLQLVAAALHETDCASKKRKLDADEAAATIVHLGDSLVHNQHRPVATSVMLKGYSCGWYTGSVIGEKRHGHGTMTYISGTWKGFIYEGSWANNRKHGHGVMVRYADSDSATVSYIGDFADGDRTPPVLSIRVE